MRESRLSMVLLGLLVFSGWAAIDAADDSPDPIRAEFEALCRSISASNQFYVGKQQTGALESRLSTPPADPVEHAGLQGLLAMEYLKHGRTDEAITLLEQALALARENSFEPQLRLPLIWNFGLAHLQAAEEKNCVALHGASSCILPIAADARHAEPEHARAAGDTFAAYLKLDPQSIRAAWLMNLARAVTGRPGDHSRPVPHRTARPGVRLRALA